MNNKEYFVPSHLDDQAKFFFWELDEFMAMMTPLFFGILMEMLMVGVVLGFLALLGMQKLKSGSARGFMKHIMYWYLPESVLKMRCIPGSHVTEFVG